MAGELDARVVRVAKVVGGVVVVAAVVLFLLAAGTLWKAGRNDDDAAASARRDITSSARRYAGLVRAALERGPVTAAQLISMRTTAWRGSPAGLAQGLGLPGVRLSPGRVVVTFAATQTAPAIGGPSPQYANYRCDFVRQGTRVVSTLTEIDVRRLLPTIERGSRLLIRL